MQHPPKKKLSRENIGFSKLYPIKVIQFGEGNFLRGFVDYAFQTLNKETDFNGGVVVIQPRDGNKVQLLNEQDGLYTLFTSGIYKGQKIQNIELITNVLRGINTYKNFQEYLDLAKVETLQFVVSNTTEAGIEYLDTDTKEMQPPSSFPGKLALFLYERFKYFKGDISKGLSIIPCELINNNADTLKELLLKLADLWQLGIPYKNWLNTSCTFHNTLVDRIVPGYPLNEIDEYNDKLEYHDALIVTAEPFFLWVIQGDDKLKERLPFHKTNLDVKIVSDVQPYRTRKVRILNGAHTTMAALSILHGNETVKQTLDNIFTEDFVTKAIFNEIIPTLPMEKAELDAFAAEVFERFRNPFISHLLSDIVANSIAKFRIRVLPSLLKYLEAYQKLPVYLTYSFACLIIFYKNEYRNKTIPINDAKNIVSFFDHAWKINDSKLVLQNILRNKELWDQDLSLVEGLHEAISFAMIQIENKGIENGFIGFKNQYQL